MRLAFGGWILDTDARQLLQGAAPVSLSPKAFDLLVYLIEQPAERAVEGRAARPAVARGLRVRHEPGRPCRRDSAGARRRRANAALRSNRAAVWVRVRRNRGVGAGFVGDPERVAQRADPERVGLHKRVGPLAGAWQASDPARRRGEHPGPRGGRRSARIEEHLAAPRADHHRRAERVSRGSRQQERHIPSRPFR